MNQKCSKLRNGSNEDSEVNNHLEKIHFADLMKDAVFMKLQSFLLPANFESDGMTSHKHGLAAKYSFKMVALESLH